MIEPQIKTEQSQILDKPAGGFDWKKYRAYLLAPLLLIAARCVFLVNKFAANSNKPENFLVDRTKMHRTKARPRKSGGG